MQTDADGNVKRIKIASRLTALEMLAKLLDLLRPDPVPAPADVNMTQVNITKVYPNRLSTDELKTLDARSSSGPA